MARPEDEFKTVFRPETSSNDISFEVTKISGRDWAKLEPDELAVIKDNWIKVLDSNGLQFQTTDGKVDSLYKSFLMLHECLEPESYEISRLKATAKLQIQSLAKTDFFTRLNIPMDKYLASLWKSVGVADIIALCQINNVKIAIYRACPMVKIQVGTIGPTFNMWADENMRYYPIVPKDPSQDPRKPIFQDVQLQEPSLEEYRKRLYRILAVQEDGVECEVRIGIHLTRPMQLPETILQNLSAMVRSRSHGKSLRYDPASAEAQTEEPATMTGGAFTASCT